MSPGGGEVQKKVDLLPFSFFIFLFFLFFFVFLFFTFFVLFPFLFFFLVFLSFCFSSLFLFFFFLTRVGDLGGPGPAARRLILSRPDVSDSVKP